MRIRKASLVVASTVVALQAAALATPRHAAAAMICGGGSCTSECIETDAFCEYLTSGLCPHNTGCAEGPDQGGCPVYVFCE